MISVIFTLIGNSTASLVPKASTPDVGNTDKPQLANPSSPCAFQPSTANAVRSVPSAHRREPLALSRSNLRLSKKCCKPSADSSKRRNGNSAITCEPALKEHWLRALLRLVYASLATEGCPKRISSISSSVLPLTLSELSTGCKTSRSLPLVKVAWLAPHRNRSSRLLCNTTVIPCHTFANSIFC